MRHYENPRATSENRCAPRSYYIPSNPGAYTLLNGIWRFHFYTRDIDVEENGTTFEENSYIKAKAVMEATGLPALADDSGISVDALNGEPGVYSARYMGEDTSYEIKNWNLIHRLNGVPEEERTARFVAVIAGVLPELTDSQKELYDEIAALAQ